MAFTLLSIGGGICLLYVGAEALVRGSAALALRMGLTHLVIGLTVVAFGTSSPEMVVSVQSSIDGNGAIAIGNVIGSNICNIALILGLSAFVRPVRVHVQVVRLQVPLMIAVSVVACLFLLNGTLGRLEGLVLFIGIIAYTAYSIYAARAERAEFTPETLGETLPTPMHRVAFEAILTLGGFALLVFGARLFVSGAVSLAGALGISQAVIGLTIVALGTSLPELATSVVASVRNHGDIAVGNVVGSNIFNILAVLGMAALVHPIDAGGVGMVDGAVMLAVSLLALPMARSGFVLSRREGLVLLLIYCGYILYLIGVA
jgi:cation:H+ antiporter